MQQVCVAEHFDWPYFVHTKCQYWITKPDFWVAADSSSSCTQNACFYVDMKFFVGLLPVKLTHNHNLNAGMVNNQDID